MRAASSKAGGIGVAGYLRDLGLIEVNKQSPKWKRIRDHLRQKGRKEDLWLGETNQ